MTKKVSVKNFKSEVIKSSKLSLVQFKTEWNGACQIISPLYESLAKQYNGNVNFFTVDVDENKILEHEQGITDIPTILFFKAGAVVDYLVGLAPRNEIVSKIEKALSETK